jgi:uncharacterized protein DUF4352/uncharacterized protein DUF4190
MSDTITTQPGPTQGKAPAEADGFAIAALVCGFVAPLLGIIFGHISNHRAKLAHRAKSGLAIAGLILGYLFTGLITLIIAVAVASASSTTTTVSNAAPASPPASSAPVTPPPASSQPATPTTPAAPPSAPTTNLAPGMSIHVGSQDGSYNGTVTIDSISKSTAPADQYGSGPQNGVFVIAKVTMTADAGQQLEVSPLDFYALVHGQHYDEGSGNSYDALSSVNSELQSTTLNGGESTTGYIVFDLPANTHGGTIIYSPFMGNGSSQSSWNING